MHPNPWLTRWPGDGGRRTQLFCFPYSGGSASGFLQWQASLSPEVEVCALQLPGRGPRLAETPLRDLDRLLDCLVEVVGEHAQAPFSFFGHSLGGLVAFELARRCRRRQLPLPERLIVSASTAPPSRREPRRLHEFDDDALIEALRDYNGTPPEALAHRELMQLLLPAIRADFAMLAGYRYQAEPPLPLPITVLAGRRDKHVPPEALDRWQDCSSLPCRQHWFEGDHFFLNMEAKAVIACVKEELARPIH
jgi:surfactin synthase thioesterase subunit